LSVPLPGTLFPSPTLFRSVFARTGTMWSFQQKLTMPEGATNDAFGVAVSLSGESALVGAAFKTIGGNPGQGAAYVFVRTGTTWTDRKSTRLNSSHVKISYA